MAKTSGSIIGEPEPKDLSLEQLQVAYDNLKKAHEQAVSSLEKVQAEIGPLRKAVSELKEFIIKNHVGQRGGTPPPV